MTGGDRCWPCTAANLAVGAAVGLGPLAAVLYWGPADVVPWMVGWAVAAVGFSLYRVLARGYLPGADRIARATGLHDRIGPGRKDD